MEFLENLSKSVVNCFQILYIRSLNTIVLYAYPTAHGCELLSDFVYSFFEHNNEGFQYPSNSVVNCFQILYIRSLNTMQTRDSGADRRCELLSDFVYSFFEHNARIIYKDGCEVVNCFQILYIRSLNTMASSL